MFDFLTDADEIRQIRVAVLYYEQYLKKKGLHELAKNYHELAMRLKEFREVNGYY